MKMKALVVAVSMCLTAGAMAQSDVEQRLADLEKRVAQSENTKKSDNAVLSHIEGVNLTVGGDVEYNMDGVSKTGGITNKDDYFAGGKGENWGLNGRILLDIDANQQTANGYFAGAHIQPLASMDGSMGLDDAEFYVGRKDDWKVKVGRYEAYDMFGLNNDTFVEYSGNTANDLYQDGYGYSYQMKEGRGRSNAGGSIMVSKNLGNWYFETNALVEDGTDLFKGSYHGNSLESKKNVVYLRPVIAYTSGPWTAAAALESNVIRNAYGYTDSNGKFVDQSKRNGYGATLKYNTGDVVWNLNAAALNASNEKDASVGTNIWWRNTEIGYIYSRNDIQKFNAAGVSGNDSTFNAPGRYDIHTFHGTYLFDNVLDMQNLNVYVGGYASFVKSSALEHGADNDRYGARVRVKYFF